MVGRSFLEPEAKKFLIVGRGRGWGSREYDILTKARDPLRLRPRLVLTAPPWSSPAVMDTENFKWLPGKQAAIRVEYLTTVLECLEYDVLLDKIATTDIVEYVSSRTLCQHPHE